MPADARDAHISPPDVYQLPEAPPPPKLPPLPPPLSLELLLLPESEPPYDPLPPDQPPPPRPDGDCDVILSLNIVKSDTITPARIAASTDPMKYQANSATRPPAAAEPRSRPSALRMMAPKITSTMMTNGLNGSIDSSETELGLCCGGGGAGKFSPSMIR